MCYRVWKETISSVYLAPPSVRYQSAAATAVIACRRFAEGKTISAEELLPLYLRLPQAERELNARMSNK
jgi:tRNA threonylcarbamoyladenosine biosynthesis protein TsaB